MLALPELKGFIRARRLRYDAGIVPDLGQRAGHIALRKRVNVVDRRPRRDVVTRDAVDEEQQFASFFEIGLCSEQGYRRKALVAVPSEGGTGNGEQSSTAAIA